MRHLVIGAGGFAQEVAWTLCAQLRARGQTSELRFFDDALPRGPLRSGLGEVVGTLGDVRDHVHGGDPVRLVMGLGLPRTKRLVAERLADVGLPWETVIHPTALVGPNSRIGDGCYLAAGAVLSVNVRLGRFVTVNVHAAVTHDDVIGDFVTLHPSVHLAGHVVIGDLSELGTGAAVIPGHTLGSATTLGPGAVATRSLPGGGTWVGSPAVALRRPAADHSASGDARRSMTATS
jgi:sugar O-acyltransferase (sialic acid O-acetyltransferase NeuD family)